MKTNIRSAVYVSNVPKVVLCKWLSVTFDEKYSQSFGMLTPNFLFG